MQEEVQLHMERGSMKASPFIKAKVPTNSKKPHSVSSDAARHKNVNKHIPTNAQTDMFVYTHMHIHTHSYRIHLMH